MICDFEPLVGTINRILVLQLGHFGDFIISLPALRQLRQAFPNAHIRLICGSWNVPSTKGSSVVDEVCGYNYFPENPYGWDGVPVEPPNRFDVAVAGTFDLAVDLRADYDTRHLLSRVDARTRCGIGSRHRFPMLDVALPTHQTRARVDRNDETSWLPADMFNSRLSPVSPFWQERRLTRDERGCLVSGPYVELQPGRYGAAFYLAMHGLLPSLGTMVIAIEVVRDNVMVAGHSFRGLGMRDLGTPSAELDFENPLPGGRFEFRVLVRGYPIGARLQFGGVRLTREESMVYPNLIPVEVHVGEQLSLLVSLIEARMRSAHPKLREPQTGRPGPD